MVTVEEEKRVLLDKVMLELFAVLAVLAASFIIVAVLYTTQFLPWEQGHEIYESVHGILGVGATIICLYAALIIYGYKTRNGQIWLGVSIANTCWLISELRDVWGPAFGMEVAHTASHDPDAIWFIGIPFAFFALIQAARLARSETTEMMMLSFGLVIAVTTLLMTAFVILPLTTNALGVHTAQEITLDVTHLVLEMVLVILSLIVILRFRGARISFVWITIALAFIAEIVADSIWHYLEVRRLFVPYHPADLLWLVSHLLLICAAYYLRYANNRKVLMII